MYAGAILPTPSRFKDADPSASWMVGPFSILIPIPNSSTNIALRFEQMY